VFGVQMVGVHAVVAQIILAEARKGGPDGRAKLSHVVGPAVSTQGPPCRGLELYPGPTGPCERNLYQRGEIVGS